MTRPNTKRQEAFRRWRTSFQDRSQLTAPCGERLESQAKVLSRSLGLPGQLYFIAHSRMLCFRRSFSETSSAGRVRPASTDLALTSAIAVSRSIGSMTSATEIRYDSRWLARCVDAACG